jgi:hypothetical protein
LQQQWLNDLRKNADQRGEVFALVASWSDDRRRNALLVRRRIFGHVYFGSFFVLGVRLSTSARPLLTDQIAQALAMGITFAYFSIDPRNEDGTYAGAGVRILHWAMAMSGFLLAVGAAFQIWPYMHTFVCITRSLRRADDTKIYLPPVALLVCPRQLRRSRRWPGYQVPMSFASTDDPRELRQLLTTLSVEHDCSACTCGAHNLAV